MWHGDVRFYKIFNKNGNTIALSVLLAGVLTVLEFTRIDELINVLNFCNFRGGKSHIIGNTVKLLASLRNFSQCIHTVKCDRSFGTGHWYEHATYTAYYYMLSVTLSEVYVNFM